MPSSPAKRLAKLHKRKVTRAKERGGVSEPDLRSIEQIKAAREASRPTPPSFQHGPVPAVKAGSAE